MRRSVQSSSLIEALEDRRLLSATFVDPVGPPINLGLVPMPTVSNVVAPVHGVTLHLKAGKAFHGNLRRLRGVSKVERFAVNASINWGDDTSPTAGTLTIGSNGSVHVKGDHTYANPGRFAIVITATSPLVAVALNTARQGSVVLETIDSFAVVRPF